MPGSPAGQRSCSMALDIRVVGQAETGKGKPAGLADIPGKVLRMDMPVGLEEQLVVDRLVALAELAPGMPQVAVAAGWQEQRPEVW